MSWLNDMFSGPADFLVGPGTTTSSIKSGDFLNDVGDSLGNIYEFGKSQLADFNDQADSDPMYILDTPGYSNPLFTDLNNKLWNKDATPIHSNYGGATEANIQNARARGIDTSDTLGVEGLGRNIVNGVLDYYTFGLGGTALDALDRKYYPQSNTPTLSKNQFATNVAVNQIPAMDTGYGAVANGTANGAIRGGVTAKANGQDIGKGIIGGAVGGGLGAYANNGTSDYSLATQDAANKRFGEGTTSLGSRLGDTQTTPFTGNTAIPRGDSYQNTWNTYQATSPIATAATEGAAKGAIGSYVTGGNALKGALMGAAQGGYGAYKNTPKEQTMNYEPDYQTSYGDMPFSLGSTASLRPSEGFVDSGNYGPYTQEQSPSVMDHFSQLQKNPWFQGLAGAVGGVKTSNPVLGMLQKNMLDKDQRETSPWYTAGQGLMALYNNNRQKQMLEGQMSTMDQNRGAYMTQLQNELARKDAASGRRTQYGPRSVELQARMAALDAQRMPTMMKLADQVGTLRNQNAASVLEGLWKNREAIGKAYGGLRNYFSTPNEGQ